jgi:ABC-type transport system substrate-binding protein
LLKEAGYPSGFSFNIISYTLGGIPQTPRIAEALAGYWQQIGLAPKIINIDYNAYQIKNIVPAKTAGDLSLWNTASAADELSRIELNFMPGSIPALFQDEGSYAIYRDNPHGTLEERNVVVDKLQQYYYDNYGPIPLLRIGNSYAWNPDKILPWPHHDNTAPGYWEYVRHAQPLNTFRLFTPLPGR